MMHRRRSNIVRNGMLLLLRGHGKQRGQEGGMSVETGKVYRLNMWGKYQMQNDFPIREHRNLCATVGRYGDASAKKMEAFMTALENRNKKWPPQPTSLVPKQVPEIPGKRDRD
jgi:hypothetical protein